MALYPSDRHCNPSLSGATVVRRQDDAARKMNRSIMFRLLMELKSVRKRSFLCADISVHAERRARF